MSPRFPLSLAGYLLNRRSYRRDRWRAIIAWNEARRYTLQSEWPKQELERLRTT
jgi:hypothetical protein